MSQARPRVFITQESAMLDYGPAEQFGEIVFLTSKDVSPVAGSIINRDIVREMDKKLRDFDFDHDWIAPSGSPVVNGLAFMVIGRIAQYHGFPGVRQLKVLRWSNRDRVYQPVVIDPHEQCD